jgi:putative methionine-R-sulfoxide reductase with GAF domain
MTSMPDKNDKLLESLSALISAGGERVAKLQRAADAIRASGGYRWVGLYDVDRAAGLVRNIVYSGPGAPDYPMFTIGKGLTGSAISTGKPINVGDVTADPRYLTAFGSTRSELIVPVLAANGEDVVGTIDVESEARDAFTLDLESLLQTCAEILRPLWAQ